MNETGTNGEERPVLHKSGVIVRINQMPVGVGAVDRNIHATQSVHNAGKYSEIYNCQVVDADAQVVQKSVFKQGRPAAGVFVHLTILIGRIDTVHADRGDIDIQVARNGNERYLPGGRTDRRDNNGIRPEIGLAGAHVGAKQRKCDRLVICQIGEGFGGIRRRVE